MTAAVFTFPREPSIGDVQRALDRVASDIGRSLDALDHAEGILLAAGDIKAAGQTLFDYPDNTGAVRDARAAAQRVLSLCEQLEGIG